jgi:hypothetical protein
MRDIIELIGGLLKFLRALWRCARNKEADVLEALINQRK